MNHLCNIKTWVLFILFGIILTTSVLAAQTDTSSAKNAADLVKSADRAVAYVVKMARESKDQAFSKDNKDAQPFWQALKKLNETVEKIDRGLFLKDETFFTSLAQATSVVEELKIAYGMSKAKDAAVKEGIEKVDATISLLRENFSKEGARLKKGGELTQTEKKQLDTIKEKQAELQNKLNHISKFKIERTSLHSSIS